MKTSLVSRRAAWIDEALDRFELLPCGYRKDSPPAAETTALAIMALAGANRIESAVDGLRWLALQQKPDGSIAPLGDLKWPGWPTPLAILAAVAVSSRAAQNFDGSSEEIFNRPLAEQWLLTAAGRPIQSTKEFGHDGSLVGWSWATGTHSWIEPTAWAVLALKSLGLAAHPRTREGVRLLVDRLLPTGGCNYGNTIVLGQRLRPHVEPTGLTMFALCDEDIDDPRVEYSLRYLASSLSAETTPISLAYGLLGLTSFDRRPDEADEWLAAKFQEVIERDGSPIKLALLTLAAQNRQCVLVRSKEKAPQ